MLHGVTQAFLPSLDHSLCSLFVAEDGYHSRRYQDSDMDSADLESTDSSDSSTMSDSDTSDTDDDTRNPLNREVINALSFGLASRLSTSESKVPKINDEVATVLDRLKDGGSHLTHLALSIDLEVQWVLTSMLRLKLRC